MKISYGLTVCNEHEELKNLIIYLTSKIDNNDESTNWYEKMITNNQTKYCLMNESPDIDESRMIGFLGQFSHQGELTISGVEQQIITNDIETPNGNQANSGSQNEKYGASLWRYNWGEIEKCKM